MEASITEIVKAIEALHGEIQGLCDAAGNAGLSIGVMHKGEDVHRSNYGFSNIVTRETSDAETVYHLASLSKCLIAASIGVLVEQGKLRWDSLLRDVLPGFHQRNKHVESQTNIVDVLAHRTGLSMRVNYWQQMEQELLLPANQTLNVLGALNMTADFRSTIKYTNWLYCAAALLIEELSGVSLEEFMQSTFFKPLGLKRTTFGVPPEDNCAASHMGLSGGTPFRVPSPTIGSGEIMAGAAGLKSTVNDMVRLYDSLLSALEDQTRMGRTSTPNNPFSQAEMLFSPHNQAGTTKYGFGWVPTELPGEIGWIGLNNGRVKKNPIIGDGAAPTSIAYHNGSIPGAMASVHTIPKSHTIIVVLSNTMAFSDLPDYVGGLILNTILGVRQKIDFLALVKECRETAIEGPLKAAAQLEAERKKGTEHRPYPEYEGRYTNAEGNFTLVVKAHGDGLRLSINDKSLTYYDLRHYHEDIFFWEVDRDAEARRAIFTGWSVDFHKFFFRCDEDGIVRYIHWNYSFDEPDGEMFTDAQKRRRD